MNCIDVGALPEQYHAASLLLYTLLRAIGALIPHHIRIGSRGRKLTRVVVVTAIPSEFSLRRLKDHFAPSIKYEYLKSFIVDKEGKELKRLIYKIALTLQRTGWSERIWTYNYRIALNKHVSLIGASATKGINKIHGEQSRLVGNQGRGYDSKRDAIFKPVITREISRT